MNVQDVLSDNYDVGTIQDVASIKSGVSNENYRIATTTGEYVLRVCHFEPQNQVNVMLPFLEYAATVNYPAPRLVKTANGQGFYATEDGPVIVTTVVDGDSGTYEGINDDQLISLGASLARLHKLAWNPQEGSKTNNTTYILDVYNQFSGAEIEDSPENKDFLAVLEQDYRLFSSAHMQAELGMLPTGLIHNDLIPDNVLFKDDTVASFVDLEEIGRGIMLLDVARVLNSWCFVNEEPQADRMAAFLKSYNESRPLTSDEVDMLPVAMHFVSFRNSVFGLKMLAQKRIATIAESKDYPHLQYVRANQDLLSEMIKHSLQG